MADTKPTTDPYADETWKPVVGWERLYEVSDHGRVRSLDRIVTEKTGLVRLSRGRILKPGQLRGKHLYVNLCPMNSGTGERSCLYVHRLVAEAFIGPIPVGMCVLHWDDNPKNNHVSNLRYGTEVENGRDRVRNGRIHNANKTHCIRGHEFVPENTTKNGRKGRACIACNRARSYAKIHGRQDQMQEISDSYFSAIIGK